MAGCLTEISGFKSHFECVHVLICFCSQITGAAAGASFSGHPAIYFPQPSQGEGMMDEWWLVPSDKDAGPETSVTMSGFTGTHCNACTAS